MFLSPPHTLSDVESSDTIWPDPSPVWLRLDLSTTTVWPPTAVSPNEFKLIRGLTLWALFLRVHSAHAMLQMKCCCGCIDFVALLLRAHRDTRHFYGEGVVRLIDQSPVQSLRMSRWRRTTFFISFNVYSVRWFPLSGCVSTHLCVATPQLRPLRFQFVPCLVQSADAS